MTAFWIIMIILSILITGGIGWIIICYQYKAYELLLSEKEREKGDAVAAARADSLKRSRSTLRGQATEHLAPFMMEGFNPKDCRFIGNPIDYLLVDGLSDLADGIDDRPMTIYLIDIKTGTSKLSKPQRRIKEAIQAGRLVFGVFNPDSKLFTEYRYMEE